MCVGSLLEREEHQRRLAVPCKAAESRPPLAVLDREGFELQFHAVHSCLPEETRLESRTQLRMIEPAVQNPVERMPLDLASCAREYLIERPIGHDHPEIGVQQDQRDWHLVHNRLRTADRLFIGRDLLIGEHDPIDDVSRGAIRCDPQRGTSARPRLALLAP